MHDPYSDPIPPSSLPPPPLIASLLQPDTTENNTTQPNQSNHQPMNTDLPSRSLLRDRTDNFDPPPGNRDVARGQRRGGGGGRSLSFKVESGVESGGWRVEGVLQRVGYM